jgi:DNA-binding NtrC family response regulator
MIETQAYTILIVEDNSGVARLMQMQMEREGFSTKVCSLGWEAREFIKAAQGKILMLLDYQLGDMPATDLLAQLENLHVDVPFIVITGKGSEQVAVDMMKRGARDYIVKNPELVDALPPLVHKVIEELEREEKRRVYGTPNSRGRQT